MCSLSTLKIQKTSHPLWVDFTNLDSPASLHTNNNIFSWLARFSLAKLETSRTVILPPNGESSMDNPRMNPAEIYLLHGALRWKEMNNRIRLVVNQLENWSTHGWNKKPFFFTDQGSLLRWTILIWTGCSRDQSYNDFTAHSDWILNIFNQSKCFKK